MGGKLRLVLEWLTVPLFLVALQLPHAPLCYWLSSSLAASAQALLLRVPAVRYPAVLHPPPPSPLPPCPPPPPPRLSLLPPRVALPMAPIQPVALHMAPIQALRKSCICINWAAV